MNLISKLKRFFSRRKRVDQDTAGKLMPVSVFLDNIQSSLNKSNESCDLKNSKFIRDYLTELPDTAVPDHLLTLTDELELAISSKSMDQVQVVYNKIRKCNIAVDASSHKLKTISVSMPSDSQTGETQAPVKIPLVSLSSLPASKITQLRLKTPLELVVDKDDEICVRFPDKEQKSKDGSLETTPPRKLTTLDMVFSDDDREIDNLIKSFERIVRQT